MSSLLVACSSSSEALRNQAWELVVQLLRDHGHVLAQAALAGQAADELCAAVLETLGVTVTHVRGSSASAVLRQVGLLWDITLW